LLGYWVTAQTKTANSVLMKSPRKLLGDVLCVFTDDADSYIDKQWPYFNKKKGRDVNLRSARSEVRALSCRGFESRLGLRCLSSVCLCCVVVCRRRPCGDMITRPWGPTVCHRTRYVEEDCDVRKCYCKEGLKQLRHVVFFCVCHEMCAAGSSVSSNFICAVCLSF
jgi:hypothetical protein